MTIGLRAILDGDYPRRYNFLTGQLASALNSLMQEETVAELHY
jgi:hypothetical protein